MSKLTRDIARTQAARLNANPMLAPQSLEGKREVVDCLMRHCQSEEHAAEVLTKFLDSALQVQNITAELAQIARATQQPDQVPAGCAECEIGLDLTTKEMRWSSHVYRDVGMVSCAARCTCERGRWLSARDAARGQEKDTPARSRKMVRTERKDFARLAAGDSE